MANIKAYVDQFGPNVENDSSYANLTMSKVGQLFTADWVTKLILAGRVYSLDLGTIVHGTEPSALTGNATSDIDQPEFIISTGSGWLIPISMNIASCADDLDAYNDFQDCLVIADRSQNYTSATSTAETATNLLDGGPAFDGFCCSIVTSDVTDPSPTDTLYYKKYINIQLASETGASVVPSMEYRYEWKQPRFLAGPCAIVGYVCGTNQPTFIGNFVFAHLPASWVVTS